MLKYFLKIMKMKILIKNLILLLTLLIALTGCDSVKEGIAMKKKANTDEFLIEKKDPLVLPPEFERLPEPITSTNYESEEDSKIDLKSIITQNQESSKKKEVNKIKNSSLEQSILEKIIKN